MTLHQRAFAGNGFHALDQTIVGEVARKGRARSTVTGRYVSESQTKTSLSGKFGVADISFDMAGPPQLNPENVLQLACMHVQGLAYLLIPNAGNGGGGIPPIVMLVHECSRGDWGSERAVAFASLTAEWLPRLVVPSAANGYFRASIRKEPDLAAVWSWALEWNQSYRLMGFLGCDEIELQGHEGRLPPLLWDREWVSYDPEHGTVVNRTRVEKPLCEADDRLFDR